MPRCPNGSRRHPPKTGVCVKNSEKPKSTKNKTQKRIKKTKSDSLSTTEIKSVIKEFSDDLDDDDFFTASDKKKIIKNAKLHNISSKKVLYNELHKYHKDYGLVAHSP